MDVFRCVVTRLTSVLVSWFEIGEPVISIADFGLRVTSVFVLPGKCSLLADEWTLGCNSLMGVLTELAEAPQTLFEAGSAVFVVTGGLVIKWLMAVFVLPMVLFEFTMLF